MIKALLNLLLKKKKDNNLIVKQNPINKNIMLNEIEINHFIKLDAHNAFDTSDSFLSIDIHDRDSLFNDVARIVVSNQFASASSIQEKLKLGYNRAGRIIDQLEAFKIVEPFQGTKEREVLIKDISTLEILLSPDFMTIKKNYFIDEFIPKNQDLINSKKAEYYRELKEKEDIQLKEILKEEILQKERTKAEKLNKQRLKQELLQELYKEDLIENTASERKREPIPQETQDRVWNRDGGRCVQCGSQEKLEFDHIIPFSKGGSNTYRNLQLLCEECNRKKSNKIG